MRDGSRKRAGAGGWAVIVALVVTAVSPASAADSPREQVLAVERAFARSMAERNLTAFALFVSDDAVFFTGAEPLRGKGAVVAGWARFFEGARAPFSWDPDQAEVLASGTLALTTGLVRNQAGMVTGRFNSIWRQEGPGVRRVVFDKGSPPEPGDQ